jgi:fucose permease
MHPDPPAYATAGSSRRLMWAGFLGIFVWGTNAGLLGAVLPGLRERVGISLSESAVLFVALSCGLVVASILAGFLLDRIGKKVVLCGAVSVVIVALVLLAFATSYAEMIALAFALGAGGSAIVTGAHALIADLNPTHRAASLNLLDVFFGIGAFATPFAIVPLQQTGGVGAVLFALAGLAALVLLYLLTVRFPQPIHAHDISPAATGRLLRSAAFLVPAAIVFLYVGTEQSIWDWQITYFMNDRGMDNVSAARVLSVFPIAIMIGRLINNRLLMRVAPGPVLLVSTVGATICLGVVMVAASAAVGGVALLLAGLFMSSIFPTALGVVSSRFPTMSGTALGLAITGGWLGSVAISPSFGFVAHRTDYWTAYAVIVGAAGAMALATVAMLKQRIHGSASAATRRDVAIAPASDPVS